MALSILMHWEELEEAQRCVVDEARAAYERGENDYQAMVEFEQEVCLRFHSRVN
jgi:hypothetical protein